MHALLSVPGGVLNRRWDGSIVSGEIAGELIADKTIVETIDTLNSQLVALGIGTKIVVRPELFSSDQAWAYVADKVPDLCGHIFIGPPHQLKYLQRVRNLACFTPVCSMAEAEQILREFAYNPRRLRSVQASLNGFAVATLLRDHKIINNPMLLPKNTLASRASAGMGKNNELTDPPVAPLFLNNHDANNSAHVMMSRLRPLTQHLASRPGILEGSPVFFATLEPHRDFPTALAPALRDFAYLALSGLEFTVIVVVEGASSLTIESLEGFAQRLNNSLKIAGFHSGLIDSDAIIITPAPQQIEGLLRLSNYLLLFDFDWPQYEINQLALRSGVKPILLANAHPALREMFLETALVLPAEIDHSRRTAADGRVPFDYPALGSLQKILAKSLVQRPSPNSRAINTKHAVSAFQNASARLKTVLQWERTYEIHFN
jgi:hypothetical protein